MKISEKCIASKRIRKLAKKSRKVADMFTGALQFYLSFETSRIVKILKIY